MNWRISPQHRRQDLSALPTTDEKVRVFIFRVDGWMLAPAERFLQFDPDGSSFAVLAVLVGYFEMIAKLLELPTESEDGRHFKVGVRAVLDSFEPDCVVDAEDVTKLYGSLRNGLFHIGFPEPDIAIDDSLDAPVARRKAHPGFLFVSPQLLAAAIRNHFTRLITQLTDENETQLRERFSQNFIID